MGKTTADLKGLFQDFARTMEKNRQALIDLDAASGDGDLGVTMTAGFGAAAAAADAFPGTDVGKLFGTVGMAIARSAPSTLGTLVASGFMRCGKELTGKEALEASDYAPMLAAFTQGIMDRGKAQPGDRTIIDALHPAIAALKSSPEAPAQAWDRAVEASRQGLEQTKTMPAKHGRAAYYGEAAFGKQDAGATVGLLIVETFARNFR